MGRPVFFFWWHLLLRSSWCHQLALQVPLDGAQPSSLRWFLEFGGKRTLHPPPCSPHWGLREDAKLKNALIIEQNNVLLWVTGAWGGAWVKEKKSLKERFFLLFSNEFDHLPSVCVWGGGRVGDLKKRNLNQKQTPVVVGLNLNHPPS